MSSVILPLIFLALQNAYPGALATEGSANDQSSVLRGISAAPLPANEDSFRFSTEPQLGGVAILVSGARATRGQHRVDVRRFVGHFRSGWEPEGQWTFTVSDSEYGKLVSRIDQLLPLPQPVCEPRDGEEECAYVCVDGPGFLIERVSAGRSLWRRGSCGPDHPNRQIALVIKKFVRRHLGHAATKDAL